MQRIRFRKSYLSYKAGDIAVVENNTAFGLIDKKIAVLSKEDKQMKIEEDKPTKKIRIK